MKTAILSVALVLIAGCAVAKVKPTPIAVESVTWYSVGNGSQESFYKIRRAKEAAGDKLPTQAGVAQMEAADSGTTLWVTIVLKAPFNAPELVTVVWKAAGNCQAMPNPTRRFYVPNVRKSLTAEIRDWRMAPAATCAGLWSIELLNREGENVMEVGTGKKSWKLQVKPKP
jgi:hypothetical protein